MKIPRPRQESLIRHIAELYGYPMAQVKNVLKEYLRMMEESVAWKRENLEPTLFGILPLDAIIRLNHGLSVIYGHESMGKTSVAKRIAISAAKADYNTIFWDAENKVFLHDLQYMKGVVIANSRMPGDLKAILRSHSVDMLVIDTVTSMEERTSFIRQMLDYAPYLVITSQMRDSWRMRKSVPACYEPTLSTSHTKVNLTHKEPIMVERVKLARIQFRIDKYEADREIEGSRGSFIIKDGIVDNVYTAYDYLKTVGRISSLGFSKQLDEEDLGGRFREVCYNKDIRTRIMSEYWAELAVGKDCPDMRYYVDDHLQSMSDKRQSTRRANSS